MNVVIDKKKTSKNSSKKEASLTLKKTKRVDEIEQLKKELKEAQQLQELMEDVKSRLQNAYHRFNDLDF